MRPWSIFGVSSLFIVAFAFAERQTDDTPEGCVRGFIDALNAKDAGKALGFLANTKSLPASSEGIMGQLTREQIQVRSTKVYGEGDDVVVIATLGTADQSTNDLFQVQKVDGHWRIVPETINPTTRSVPPSWSAAFMVSMGVAKQVTASPATVCLSNVKQLGLGNIIYANDYDDRMPPSDHWKSGIMPYVKNKATFHCPDDKRPDATSYRMSDFLSKVLTTAISQPAATVMEYEGESGYLVARHEGKGSVAYADGHAKLVSPDVFISGYHKP